VNQVNILERRGKDAVVYFKLLFFAMVSRIEWRHNSLNQKRCIVDDRNESEKRFLFFLRESKVGCVGEVRVFCILTPSTQHPSSSVESIYSERQDETLEERGFPIKGHWVLVSGPRLAPFQWGLFSKVPKHSFIHVP